MCDKQVFPEGTIVYVSDTSEQCAVTWGTKRIYLNTNKDGLHQCVSGGYESRYLENMEYTCWPWLYVVPVFQDVRNVIEIPEGYEALAQVLKEALEQASIGKGKERHANDDAFKDQLMVYMANQIGIAGPVFQVVKKAVESCRLPYPANVKELLGAINYAAGAIISLKETHDVKVKGTW